MNRLKLVISMMLCGCLGAGAQEISLSGRIVEPGTSNGIAGVTVKLSKKSGATTTSGNDGSFSINDVSAIEVKKALTAKQFALRNNMLVFFSTSSDVVAKVNLFAVNGKKLASLKVNLFKGEQSIMLPKLSSGINFMHVTIGDKSYYGTIYSLNNKLSLSNEHVVKASINHSIARQADVVSVDDTIVTSKSGYITTKTPISSYSQNNITIEMVKDQNPQNYTDISLLTNSITVTGSGATANGTEVVITSGGTYNIHGRLTDGRIVVRSEDESNVVLVLNNAEIANSKTSPLFIEKAEFTVIELADGSDNTFSDASAYTTFFEDDEPNATVFSKDELGINGSGKLTINSNYNDAIACKDGLTITGGDFTINSVDDGIRGKDELVIKGGTFNLTVSGDGLVSTDSGDVNTGYVSIENGNFKITADKDGIQAENYISISGGTFDLKTGGGSTSSGQQGGGGFPGGTTTSDNTESAKAIKATNGIKITGGTFTINSADDALHSNGSITISNGNLTIATDDDGVHADSTFTMDGGEVDITKSYEGFEASKITLNGGKAILVTSDDGVNVAGGSDGSGMGGTRPGDFGGGTGANSASHLLQINDGFWAVYAGGDGLDANGNIEINGGTTLVHGPTSNGNGIFDIGDGSGYYFVVNGGFLLGAGTSAMAVSPATTSKQNCITAYLSQSAGTLVNLQNASGENLFTFSPGVSYGLVVFSSPELVNGTYKFYYGGTVSGTKEEGLYSNETYTPGTALSQNVSVSSRVTKIGTSSGGGGF